MRNDEEEADESAPSPSNIPIPLSEKVSLTEIREALSLSMPRAMIASSDDGF